MMSDNSNNNKQPVGNYVHISDRYVPPRAEAVLPGVLQIRHDLISPRRSLPSRVRFGPVQGVTKLICHSEATKMIERSVECKLPLFLLKREGDQNCVTHLDVTDKDKSNWLGLLPLGDQSTANVWLYEEDNELYAITTKPIPSRVPLKLGYSIDYVKTHKYPPETTCLDIHEALSTRPCEWRCYECHRALPSAALLQDHMDTEHKDSKVTHRRYRCHRCKKTFTRLFTLKRHRIRHCTDKEEQSANSMELTDKIPANVELTMESQQKNSRELSKETIQNFNSSIDFNSLLDAYRISNLNLSNSSKTVKDLIEPESQVCKDISSATEDSLTKLTADAEVKSHKNMSLVNEKSIQIVNDYLSEHGKNTKSDRQQEHVSEIRKEIFSCKCGQVFLNKDKLIQHIMDHCNSTTNMMENSDIMYKCEDCQLIFKRRGMFVNHLWRVHRNTTTRVPLERRVQHFPCAACPALYRTAAKRQRHFDKHHPDVSTSASAGGCVQRGRRACAAAACAACPRQYATRAKLLQHVRDKHPQHALPVKKSEASAASKQ